MEFAEGHSARPLVSIVLTKECVLTQDNKAYRDKVLSSPPNSIGCRNFLSVSFHTKDVFLCLSSHEFFIAKSVTFTSVIVLAPQQDSPELSQENVSHHPRVGFKSQEKKKDA